METVLGAYHGKLTTLIVEQPLMTRILQDVAAPAPVPTTHIDMMPLETADGQLTAEDFDYIETFIVKHSKYL